MKLLTLNIRHGGGSRIKEIIQYLNNIIDHEVIVLTEFRSNKNSNELFKFFETKGFYVSFHSIEPNINTVLIASKMKAKTLNTDNLGDHQHRILYKEYENFRLMGCYFPQKKEKAKVFDYILNNLGEDPLIVIGDFNTGKHLIDERGTSFYCSEYLSTLEENQMVDAFRKINGAVREYSWYSNSGNGFRIDHIFISKQIQSRIEECGYDHLPRDQKISDHSAMFVTLDL